MIRDLQEKDLPRLREMHAATGFVWDFPEGLFSAKVWVDEQDQPLMLVGAKVIAEAVVITGKDGTPGMRLAMLEALAAEVYADTARMGIGEAVAWIPNAIWRPFARRLRRLGWNKCGYNSMTIRVR